MGGLSFLIYPWGLIVQGVALWHFVKRRPEGYWLWIIIFGGVLGAGVYVVAEMIPDWGCCGGRSRDSARARGFKTSKFRFWTIRRRGIWRNWRSFILSRRSLRRRGNC